MQMTREQAKALRWAIRECQERSEEFRRQWAWHKRVADEHSYCEYGQMEMAKAEDAAREQKRWQDWADCLNALLESLEERQLRLEGMD